MSEQSHVPSVAGSRHICTAACNWFTCDRVRLATIRRRAVEDEVRRARCWWRSFLGARRQGSPGAAGYEREARESMQHARWLRAFHTQPLAALDAVDGAA